MRKITKPAQKCSKCGHTIKYEEYEEFCDECGKKAEWNRKTGFPIAIRFLTHQPDLGGDDFNFCSIKCMFKWLLKNGKKQLKHPDDFFSLDYWNRKNIDDLFECLNKKKLNKK